MIGFPTGNLLYAVPFRFHPLPLSINTPRWDRYEVLECDISSKWSHSLFSEEQSKLSPYKFYVAL